MARQKYIYRDGELIPAEEAQRVRVHNVITDTMDGTWHPVDGAMYDSKSNFRKTTRAHGYQELGNEKFEAKKPDRQNIKRSLLDTWDKLGLNK